MDFKITLEQDEDGWYIVTVPVLPGCVSQGKTEEEAKKNITEAIDLHLSALARDGVPLYQKQGVIFSVSSTNPGIYPQERH